MSLVPMSVGACHVRSISFAPSAVAVRLVGPLGLSASSVMVPVKVSSSGVAWDELTFTQTSSTVSSGSSMSSSMRVMSKDLVSCPAGTVMMTGLAPSYWIS